MGGFLERQAVATFEEQLQRQRERITDARRRLYQLELQLRQYEVSGPQGQSALQVSREDLRRITAFGGLAAVDGQGIEVDVNGQLDPIALNDLVNELRNAGAEAIAVNGVRITARSVAIQGPRGLQVDGVDVGQRFTLRAIGSPDGLLSAMQRPGGIISQLKLFVSATIEIRQVQSVVLPASAVSLLPVVGKRVQ